MQENYNVYKKPTAKTLQSVDQQINFIQSQAKQSKKDFRIFILPFLFVVRAKIISQCLQNNTHNKNSNRIIKFVGTLSHQNGSPLNLRDARFIIWAFKQHLSKFFFICQKSYQIKFIYQYSIEGPLQYSDQQQFNVSSYLNKKQIISALYYKIQQNKQYLKDFLTKIGINSTKNKFKNRYRNIFMSLKSKRELYDILRQHQQLNQQSSLLYSQLQLNLQAKSHEKKKIRKQKANIMGKLPVEIFKEKKKLQCCLTQQKYQNYPQIKLQDSCVKQLQNLQICDINFHQAQQQGGYFSVKYYQADYSIKSIDNCVQQKDLSSNDYGKEKKITLIREQGKGFQQSQESSSIYNQSDNKQQGISLNNFYTKKGLGKEKCGIKTYEGHFQVAIKKLRNDHQNQQKYLKKVEYEKELVRKIGKNPYVCQYYTLNHQNKGLNEQTSSIIKDSIIMQSLYMSLKQLLYKRISFNLFQVCKQLVKAVQKIHSYGIVHRDIKPGNIMFSFEGFLKIIDFSQSVQCWNKFSQEKFRQSNIGFTLPYSPIQCSSVCEQGYSNFKIDNWSVGITILQVLIGRLPVCYSKSMKQTLKKGWDSEQFNWCLNLRAGNLNNQLLLPIKILCLKLLNNNSRKRICLNSVLRLLNFYQQNILKL